jgi:general L-amino acid transport system permease protein
MIPAREPPIRPGGPVNWLRANLFGTPLNALISIVTITVTAWVLVGLTRWVVYDAVWEPIWVNLQLFMVYRYPSDLLWRPLAVVAMIMFLLGATSGMARRGGGEIVRGLFWSFFGLVLLVTLLALFAFPNVRYLWVAVSLASLAGFLMGRFYTPLAKSLYWLWGASLPAAFILIAGVPQADEPMLRTVEARNWGGFMLTLILAVVGITASFPIGVALALGRRSRLPAIKYFCIGFIEIIRGAPLITWLFIASLMVPLIFNVSPERIDALTRALVAIILFSSAYMAENVRGGLQAVPRGQYEAAQALGLSGWQTMSLIVLPQALRAVIPAIVGQSIGLFKDTSLVFIVGLFEFFNVSNLVANQPESLLIPGGIRMELSLFVATIYFFFCYRMSVASRQLERQLGLGTR